MMAMNTEFMLTPWPTSPLWPLYRFLRWRVPTCPEPSLVQLGVLSCIAAFGTAAFQVFLPYILFSLPWLDNSHDASTAESGKVASAGLLMQLLSRTSVNLRHVALFCLLMRALHWTTRRIFWLRLYELLMHYLHSTSDKTKSESAEYLGRTEGACNQTLRNQDADENEQRRRLFPETKVPEAIKTPPTVINADQQQTKRHGDSKITGSVSASKEKRIIPTIVVLGSGGHTTEMLRLLADFDLRRFRCVFVVGDSDHTSESQACELLKAHPSIQGRLVSDVVQFVQVTRCREVGQPLHRVPLRALRAFVSSLRLVFRARPRLVLVNGPGTCVPVVAAALVYEFLMGATLRVVYAESFCRVSSLSLSGLCIYAVADRFLVQWRPLADRFRYAEYTGLLC